MRMDLAELLVVLPSVERYDQLQRAVVRVKGSFCRTAGQLLLMGLRLEEGSATRDRVQWGRAGRGGGEGLKGLEAEGSRSLSLTGRDRMEVETEGARA